MAASCVIRLLVNFYSPLSADPIAFSIFKLYAYLVRDHFGPMTSRLLLPTFRKVQTQGAINLSTDVLPEAGSEIDHEASSGSDNRPSSDEEGGIDETMCNRRLTRVTGQQFNFRVLIGSQE